MTLTLRPLLAPACGLLAILFFVAAPVTAQDAQRQRLDASGTIRELGSGSITMITTEGDIWQIAVDKKLKDIHVIGRADPSWVKSGMLVQFVGQFTAQGKSTKPIRQLTVFTPSDDYKMGISADAGISTAGLFSDEPAPKAGEETKSFKVAGQLRGIRGNNITVLADRTAVSAQLDPKVSISIDVADLSLVEVGDKISIKGYATGTTTADASWVSITKSEPLGSKRKGN